MAAVCSHSVRDWRESGFRSAVADRPAWGEMRMNRSDLSDVSGATYTYLTTGHTPAANWTGLFRISSGETIDVIVEPFGQDAFTIYAQSLDRTGYARGTLVVRQGLDAPARVPGKARLRGTR